MRRPGLSRVADVVMAPLVYPSAWLLRVIRERGVQNFPRCKEALLAMGVFPIRDHYTEPQFNLGATPGAPRKLGGITWNVPEQLDFLRRMSFASELEDVPVSKTSRLEFYVGNGSFGPGDAEYWYQLLRLLKPRRVFEIGSGNSTLMAVKALKANERETGQRCRHLCVEPYEAGWLEQAGVEVLRTKVEDVGLALFGELEPNDVLFIDSSHVIRPGGDVLFEYLELLPRLRPGVMVHIHDIFSPRDYPAEWLVDWVRLWNEQYVLEAFLSENPHWKIVGALNHLRQEHFEELKAVAPFLTHDDQPASFYIQRVS